LQVFELRPNCSLTPRAAVLFYAWVTITSLSVAGYFVALGMWPVLPFAGLELAGLGAALTYSISRGRSHEKITVTAERVNVELHQGRVRRTIGFPRAWTRVELRQSRLTGHPSRLLLGSAGRYVEVGRCLTENNRRRQEYLLRGAIGALGESPDLGMNEPTGPS